MGRVSKGVKCSVVGCEKTAIRSIASDRVALAGLNVADERRAYLCEEHYKVLKKKMKKSDAFEKWRHGI